MEKITPLSTSLLIEAVQCQVHHFENVELICQDGSVMTCGLLLAAVSPVIRQCGKEDNTELLTILLPDFTVSSNLC